MLKLILVICLITFISSSSYYLEDIMDYYSLNIGTVYSNNKNYIKFIKASDFSLSRYNKPNEINLYFNIQIEAFSPVKTETLSLEVKAVNTLLIFRFI
jgi:hypothetical protein